MAYGFNNLFEGGVNIVDEMIVGHWNGLAHTKLDYTPDPNLDFSSSFNRYGSADGAVAFYWYPLTLADGFSKSFENVYGLGEFVEPDHVFSIRLLDPVQKMETNEELTAYLDDGIFEINVEIENLWIFRVEHDEITASLQLQPGLVFVDETGNEMSNRSDTS